MSDFSTPANPAQLEAITTTDGLLLIIAGPGSGETFLLVERTAYLVEEQLGVAVAQTRPYYTGETFSLPHYYSDKDDRAIQQAVATFDAIVARIEAKD